MTCSQGLLFICLHVCLPLQSMNFSREKTQFLLFKYLVSNKSPSGCSMRISQKNKQSYQTMFIFRLYQTSVITDSSLKCCYRLNGIPYSHLPNSQIEILTPNTSLGDKVFTEIIKLKSGHWGGLSNVTGVLTKRENLELDVHTRTACEEEDDHPQAKERHLKQLFPSQIQERTNLINTMIFDFQAPNR